MENSKKSKMVRVTFDLPELIVISLKISAAKKRLSMRQVVMSALLVALNAPEVEIEK